MVRVLQSYLKALSTEPATLRLAVQEALSTLQPLYVPLPPVIVKETLELLRTSILSVRSVDRRTQAPVFRVVLNP